MVIRLLGIELRGMSGSVKLDQGHVDSSVRFFFTPLSAFCMDDPSLCFRKEAN